MDMGEPNKGNSQIHPLSIELVLERTLQYLSLKQLQVCRQVCWDWQVVATKLMTRTESNCKTINTDEELLRFIACMQKKKEYSKLPFNVFDFRAPSLSFKEYFVVFDLCGPHMRSLALNSEYNLNNTSGLPVESMSIETLMDILINKAHNLVHLTIGMTIRATEQTSEKCWDLISPDVPYDDGPLQSYQNGLHLTFPEIPKLTSLKFGIGCSCVFLQGFLQDLFKSLTNLKTLDLSLRCPCYQRQCNIRFRTTVVLSALHAAERDSTVKELQLQEFGSEVLNSLIQMSSVGRLKLVKIGNENNCVVSHGDLASGLEWSLLFANQPELVDFTLISKINHPVADKINPMDLKSLKLLKISSFQKVRKFNVASSTPRLESLNVYEVCDRFLRVNEAIPTTSVTSFEIKDKMDMKCIKSMALGFPCLQKLKVHVNGEYDGLRYLTRIWEMFPTLQTLQLTLHVLDTMVIAVNETKKTNINGIQKIEFSWRLGCRWHFRESERDSVMYMLFNAVRSAEVRMPNLQQLVFKDVNLSEVCSQRIVDESRTCNWKTEIVED